MAMEDMFDVDANCPKARDGSRASGPFPGERAEA